MKHHYSGAYPPTTSELADWLLRLEHQGEIKLDSYLLQLDYTKDGTPFIAVISPKPEGEEQKPLKPPNGWGLFRRRGPQGELINGPVEYDEVILPDLRNGQQPMSDSPNLERVLEVYRGVSLTEDERKTISVWLQAHLDGVGTEELEWIEHLYVADALVFHAEYLIKRGLEAENRVLLRLGCESAQRATKVAPDESYFLYRFARCLDAGGYAEAAQVYQIFLERAASMLRGSRAYSPVHQTDFREAIQEARRRLDELTK